MSRVLYSSYLIGSHLYGDAKPTSDVDHLNLWVPTMEEIAENRRITLQSTVSDGVDTRNALLGDFVMSLGDNPEHTLFGLTFLPFVRLRRHFLRRSTALKMFASARSVIDSADKIKPSARNKTLGQAWRYLSAASCLYANGFWSGYPMTGTALETYKQLRQGTYTGGLKVTHSLEELYGEGKLPDEPRDTETLARWVLGEYNRLMPGGLL